MSVLKVEIKENRERKFQGHDPAWIKAQRPKTPSSLVLLEHEIKIAVARDVIGGRQGPGPKRTELCLVKEFGMFGIVPTVLEKHCLKVE